MILCVIVLSYTESCLCDTYFGKKCVALRRLTCFNSRFLYKTFKSSQVETETRDDSTLALILANPPPVRQAVPGSFILQPEVTTALPRSALHVTTYLTVQDDIKSTSNNPFRLYANYSIKTISKHLMTIYEQSLILSSSFYTRPC